MKKKYSEGMGNERIQMAYVEYMKPMEPELCATGIELVVQWEIGREYDVTVTGYKENNNRIAKFKVDELKGQMHIKDTGIKDKTMEELFPIGGKIRVKYLGYLGEKSAQNGKKYPKYEYLGVVK